MIVSNKRGRPKKEVTQLCTQINITVTIEEKHNLLKQAKALGMTPGKYVAMLMVAKEQASENDCTV